MRTYFIYPKGNRTSKTEMQFIDYTKKEAIALYRQKFPQYNAKELSVSKTPYFNF